MISVIIPTWNEAPRLPRLLAALKHETTAHEVIVADGGSQDDTVAIASRANVQVISAPRGRGQQIVAGVAAARGDILFFLHADCQLPKGALTAIAAKLAEAPNCPGGNFRLLFDGGGDFARWLTGFYARIRARGFYYGDSGIFVRRAIYQKMGGMRAIELMEDYEFVRRLEKIGPTCCIETPPLITSSRRFQGRRRFAIILGWLEIHALFYLGIPPKWLAWRYRSYR